MIMALPSLWQIGKVGLHIEAQTAAAAVEITAALSQTACGGATAHALILCFTTKTITLHDSWKASSA